MNNRTRIELDGAWQFVHDATGKITFDTLDTTQEWRTAQVPMPWQAQFDDLRMASGTGWYRRDLTLEAAPNGAAILHFGAVDYHATVWVNGHRVGEHEGGYLPFEFDIARYLHAGSNQITVRAIDPGDDVTLWPDFPFSEIPHGKQSWYGPIGGIWQSVWLEMRPALHLRAIRLTPTIETRSIDVAAAFSAPLPEGADAPYVHLRLYDPNGTEIATSELGRDGRAQIFVRGNLQLWSPDHPALYTVSAELRVKDEVSDEVRATCGFRTVEARDGRIYLNGEPIYLRGALDQAYYPETIYTVPSVEFLEDQLRKSKALGLNCLRCHIKVEDPRYYEVADRLGMLIWTEIPNWAHLSPQAALRAKETFAGIVERDWNHPSIIIWTLVNENWGTDLVRNAGHRQWLADFYHAAKAMDPTRLIVDNSACRNNFHVASDLDDYHDYRAIPDHAHHWDAWVADFAGRPEWSWASDFTHERREGLPLIVSEFGNWGLPNPEDLQEHGREPWWFETGSEWGEGVVYPHGMQERFNIWGLGSVFGTMQQFVTQHQIHMAHSLAYEIATMRLHPTIGGYVITELTDLHWECNGLMNMQRRVKEGLHDILAPLNQDRVVVARPLRWNGKPGETLAINLQALDVDGPGQVGVIRWQAASNSGEVPAPGGIIEITLPAPGIVPVTVEWLAPDGTRIAHSRVEVTSVAPYPAEQYTLYTGNDRELGDVLSSLGYRIASRIPDKDGLWVTRVFTAETRAAIQQGVKMLMLAGDYAPTAQQRSSQEIVGLPIGSVVARAGTVWHGDWATSYSWLKKQGPFAHLPGNPLLEMDFASVMPDYVIAGVPTWAYRHRSWAGLALGWIHRPVSLLVTAPYGQGALTATTFKLTPDTLSSDAIAQALFGGIVELARSA